ncbi:hypothetical protein PVAG01_05488 [Phlyctema vagabunda]|uniref:Uncharacterized protein n=1 Tax=Phlyctema vagabunda TaxID=108571 RepID=A0ABR4PLD0_9HELO
MEHYTSLPIRGDYLTQSGTPARIGGLVYSIVGMICISVIASCLTLRVTTIRRSSSIRSLSAIHFLMLAIYIIGLASCMCSLILFYGYGTEDQSACHLAIITCLTFYLGQKLPIYIFLVERAHIVRAVTRTRLQDCYYVGGLLVVILGFGTLTVILFVWRTWSYDHAQKICRIGFSIQVAIALLVFDILFNLALTVLFVYFLRSYLTKGLLKAFVPRGVADLMVSKIARISLRPREISIVVPQTALIRVIRNTIFGCIAMCLTGIPNVIILIVLDSQEDTWLCYTFCTIDVTWAVLVIHWLTTIHSDFVILRSDTGNRSRPSDCGLSHRLQLSPLAYTGRFEWREIELDTFSKLRDSIDRTEDTAPSTMDEGVTIDTILEDFFGLNGTGRIHETANDGGEMAREEVPRRMVPQTTFHDVLREINKK